jgi:phosphatidylcholine synthase
MRAHPPGPSRTRLDVRWIGRLHGQLYGSLAATGHTTAASRGREGAPAWPREAAALILSGTVTQSPHPAEPPASAPANAGHADTRLGPRTRLALAWAVHLLTASGAVFGAIALISISRGDLSTAALLMIVALVIDAIDGTLARAVGVGQVLPSIDGRRLDDIVDYLNYVIVPAVFLVGAGLLPSFWWAALPVLSSAYGFSQNDAKTEDDFFLGWPSYWNVLALYLWMLDFTPVAGAAWVVGLSIAVFVPVKYVYPSKIPQPFFRHTLNWGGLVWAGALGVAIVAPETAEAFRIVEVSLGYVIYYLVLSAWLGDWRSTWA